MSYINTSRIVPVAAMVMLVAGCASGSNTPETKGSAVAPEGRNTGVTSTDLANNPSIPIEQVLQSKVAGVVVSRTEDGGIAIRIRGASTVNSSNAPLYVVDGVAIEAGPNGGLTGINPYDIASIKVLKEAADISMYGSRGANGVIIIKTKRPNQ